MRVLCVAIIAATAGLAACAGPAPSGSDQALAYRTGSRLKQPDTVEPDRTYYSLDQFANSPDYKVSGVIGHSVPTPVPPPPEQAPQ